MKNINLIIFGALAIILAIVGGVTTLMSFNKYDFKVPAEEMLEKVTTENHFIKMTEVNQSENRTNQIIIDIRTPKEFINNHIPDAQNIPYVRILDDEFSEIMRSDKTKVIYGSTMVTANAAWMILAQYGYNNLMVMDGSMEDWDRHIEKKDLFKSGYKSDEEPKFDYTAEMKK